MKHTLLMLMLAVSVSGCKTYPSIDQDVTIRKDAVFIDTYVFTDIFNISYYNNVETTMDSIGIVKQRELLIAESIKDTVMKYNIKNN